MSSPNFEYGPPVPPMSPPMHPFGPMQEPAEENDQFAALKSAGKGLDLLRVYPFTFAFLSMLVFLGPIVKMTYLSFDLNVQYWIGAWTTYVAAMPLVFIWIAYVIHRIKGQPSKLASLIGLLGPSLVLFIGGYKVAMTSLTLSTALGSTDCITNPQMNQLGLDYKGAVDFKSKCQPLNGEKISSKTPIEECAGYDAAFGKNPSWQYLSQLEKTSGCAGWCEATTPLWGYPGGVRDPCSSVASDALTLSVLYPSMQVAIYNILALFLATLGMAVLGPKAANQNQGLSW